MTTPTQHTTRKIFCDLESDAGIEGARMFHDSPAMESRKLDSPRRVLGVEGGGTKTDWVLLDERGSVLREGQLPSAHLKLSSEPKLLEILGVLPREVTEAGVFLAGCL